MATAENTSASRRRLLAGGSAALAAVTLGGAGVGCDSAWMARPHAGNDQLRLLSETRWPHRSAFGGAPVGGLSGIDRDASTGEYLLLSDDRSDRAPARFFQARWPSPADGQTPTAQAVVFLQQPGGGPWPDRDHATPGLPVADPEALRVRPDTGTVLWTTEGDVARGFGPAFYESARDGRLLREFVLPPMFHADPAQARGPRDNLGFEGLALTPDGRHAWLAMENALVQDGAIPTAHAAGGPCRFTRIDLITGTANRQIAYVPDALPLRPRLAGTYADNGVSEVLMLDGHRMLVLERAYATGRGNSLRLYEIDTRNADDVLAIDALQTGNHRTAAKTLVADFAALGLSRLDNSEGMCWCPPLPNGRRLLLVMSDDNFNPLQITQFAAFESTDRP